MSIIILIVLAILLALALWLGYRNVQHPYLRPTKPLGFWGQLRFQRHVCQRLTQNAPKLRALFIVTQAAWLLGLLLILISTYQLESKLTLLIFPTGTAIISVILLITGSLLLLVPALVWPSQSYRYWENHVKHPSFNLSNPTSFRRYRRQNVGSLISLILFILVAWISRAIGTSTAPTLVIDYLIVTVIAAIPITALITLLIQWPYLYQTYYLLVKPGQRVKFGKLRYRANQALLAQRPESRKTYRLILIVRGLGYALVLVALWTLYTNILAPSFAVDPTAVFPAAIEAIIALVTLEIVDTLWSTKRYHYLQQLDTTNLPFTVADAKQFARYHDHLFYYHLCAGISWVSLWLALVGSYYYFG